MTLRKGEVIVLYSSYDIGVSREGLHEGNDEEQTEMDRKRMPVYKSVDQKKEEEDHKKSAVRGSSPRRTISVVSLQRQKT